VLKKERPVFFISSPYPLEQAKEILGFAAYSHKILAEKILHYLKPFFDVEYVFDENELEARVLIRGGKLEKYYLLYVGPPEGSWTSTLCKNILVFTWEFPDIPEGSPKQPGFNWIPFLSKYNLVVLPNRVLQNRLNELGIPNVFMPLGRYIVGSSGLKSSEAYNLLAGVAGIKFENIDSLQPTSTFKSEHSRKIVFRFVEILNRLFFKLKIYKFTPEFIYKRLRNIYRDVYLRNYHSHQIPLENFHSFENLSMEIYGRIVIGSWLNISDERKNFDTLIKAYGEVGQNWNNVILIVKVIGDELEITKASAILSDLNKRMCEKLPPIVLLFGYLEQEILDAIKVSTDIYLNTSSAEGICMPALEHAVNGVELVIPRNSSFIDYFSEKTANFYDVDRIPTHFPSDSQKVLMTNWNPPIFRNLVEALNQTIENHISKNRKVPLSKNQQKLRVEPKDFVSSILECLNDSN